MTTTGLATGAYAAARNLMKPAAFGAGSAMGAALGNAAVGGTGAAGGGFGQLLSGAVEGVAETGRKAETQAIGAASGKANLVDVVTAVAESETALQTLVAVRDRVISAYEEIMRMPI